MMLALALARVFSPHSATDACPIEPPKYSRIKNWQTGGVTYDTLSAQSKQVGRGLEQGAHVAGRGLLLMFPSSGRLRCPTPLGIGRAVERNMPTHCQPAGVPSQPSFALPVAGVSGRALLSGH